MKLLIIALNIFYTTSYTFEQNATVTRISNNWENTFIQDQKEKNKKALFEYHFKILDSIVALHPSDTIYGGGCFQSILFMVKNTKIEVSTDAGVLGRLTFSKT